VESRASYEHVTSEPGKRRIIIIIIIITATEFSIGGGSPYTNTDKTNKNKYT
jgi:hypothetical protein